MAKAVIALDMMAAVVRGQFNAAIFSPAWLLHQNIIGPSEYADAEIEVITSEFALFRVGWLTCQVSPDTLSVSTTDPDEFERVRDAAVGVLSTLSHTPVAALGINREMHFSTESREQFHAIGDLMAPKNFWEPLLNFPATRTVTVWGRRPNGYGGRTQVKIEPSVRFLEHIFMAHNDHYNLEIVVDQPTSRDEAWFSNPQSAVPKPSADNIPTVTEILASEWSSCIKRSNEVKEAIARV